MRDVTYIKLVIFGKKPATTLADANYDGKISMLDVGQTKLIILGKEKQLTLVDSADRIVTVNKPVERIVVTFRQALEMVRSVGVEENQVVGVESLVQSSGEPPWGVNYKIFFPEYQDKPTVGLIWEPNCEAILSLRPDMVMLMAKSMGGDPALDNAQNVLESAGIAVIRVYGGVWGKDILEEVDKLGYIFDKRDEAGEFIEWYEGIMNSIEDTVDGIPEEDKPKVYFECATEWNNADESRALVGSAGGRNIFPDLRESVNPEAIIDQNPDVIVKAAWSCGGYNLDTSDTVELEEIREKMMSRLELGSVKAVEEERADVEAFFKLHTWQNGSILIPSKA
jgi:iron complex transport system substrate-binding protein